MVGSSRDQSVWDHFQEYVDPAYKGRRVRCLHCSKSYGANATTQREHLKTCTKYIDHMRTSNQTSNIFEKALEIQANGPDATPKPPRKYNKASAQTPTGQTLTGNGTQEMKMGSNSAPPTGRKRQRSPSMNLPYQNKPPQGPQEMNQGLPPPQLPLPPTANMSGPITSRKPQGPLPGMLVVPKDGHARFVDSYYWARFSGTVSKLPDCILKILTHVGTNM